MHQKTNVPVGHMLKALGLSWSRYHDWKRRFGQANKHNGKIPRDFWLEPWEIEAIVNFKHQHPETGYRYLTYMMLDQDIVAVSPATTYRIPKSRGLTSRWNDRMLGTKKKGFTQPLRPHEHWHIDISYINFLGTYLFLIAVLDGFSRYIVHHELRINMQEYDVELVLQRALEKYPNEHSRLITDNGSQFLALDFKKFLKASQLTHVRTSVNHPQSNGKIEAFHKIIKSECIRRESMLSLEDARRTVASYIHKYNTERLHGAIGFITPFDKLNGNAEKIFKERDRKLEEARKRRQRNAKRNLKMVA
ncbi:IS3 family transposase [candidate division KSB1 bacterium]|nr:IS3 family transposase [candidate division KSB1 bacterium]